jgi:hypothetical protein
LTLSEYAHHRGVRPAVVEEAVLGGRITRNAAGGVDPDVADREWEANTDPQGRKERKKRDESAGAAAGAAAFKTVSEARAARAAGFDVEKLGKMSFADARAVEKNIDAKLKLVELQEREGELLQRAEVLKDVGKLVRVTRDHLLNIPARIAAQVVALTELSDVEATIAEEITVTLEDLADALKRMAEGDPQ